VSSDRKKLITIGIMLSLFLASMEGTVVSTAMPSIVGQMGGLSIYSWVFSIFMLTSTTTGPVYGKLSDLYGRRLVFTISMAIFLIGSVLCGLAQTMEQLIFFRGIQGLGAGGVLPLAFTIVGEIFSLEQRTKMQGLFSGVWGVSAVVGPLIGGFLVDRVSWQWVFYINIFPGLISVGLVWAALRNFSGAAPGRVTVDYAGALLLTLGTLALLLGLNDLGSAFGWLALILAAILLAALVWVERRVKEPILPLALFRDRVFVVSILHGVFAGWAMFGGLSFIPLFVQGVLGTSATQAGISLTPMSLSWTLASIIGASLLLKMGYRTLSLLGMVLLLVGALLMTQIGVQTSVAAIMVYTGMMGVGMGLSIPAFLIAVQSVVRRQDLGAATSALQFSRSIGGTLGVSVLGAYLSASLSSRLAAAGAGQAVEINSLLDSVSAGSAAVVGSLRQVLAISIADMFWIAFVAAILALLVVLFAPSGTLTQLASERGAN
jgi:EmrB/QacA subfamily drug resistance transporter